MNGMPSQHSPSLEAGAARTGRHPGKLVEWLAHVVCVVSLMWTPLVNGQAFYFFDTTNYVRAADMALYMASGKKITTVWTGRYAAKLPGSHAAAPAVARPADAKEAAVPPTHNDISSGLVMAGRSPYIGALMYLGYLSSNFWLFILLQAGLSYFLIRLALRRFGITAIGKTTLVTLAIALTTSISYYNGLLLPDAFAAFGILSFLLLATPGRLSKAEMAVLVATIAMSVAAHLTHIVILMTMVTTSAILVTLRLMPPVPRRAWFIGIGGVLLGFASIQATAFATKLALGNKPQLLPLFTARFIADGPGLKYIAAGCDNRRFQICRVRIGDVRNASVILSGIQPGVGTYLQATPDERRRMGEEDTAFAWAVFRFDPLEQFSAIVRNSFEQLTWVEYDGLNMGCFKDEYCWVNLPKTIRSDLQRSLSGQNAWPKSTLDVVQRAVVVLSLLGLMLACLRPSGFSRERWLQLRSWIIITGLAMVVNAGFGGGIVEPQYRYITRMIWLLPLFALIALQLAVQSRRKA